MVFYTMNKLRFLFVFNFLFLLLMNSYAKDQLQPTKLPLVMKKFETDKISYAQFKYFGKSHCLDRYYNSPNKLFISEINSSFNHLYPLPRIILTEAIEDTVVTIEKYNNIIPMFKKSKSTKFVDPIKICHELYSNDKLIKKYYLQLINNKKSYDISRETFDEEDYFQDYFQDYLEKFFIDFPGMG